MTTYTAIRCPCGHRSCSSWMVDPVAVVHGVSFTEEQASAVAALLNGEIMAKTMSRRGGLARAVNLTPERRSEIAREAARARWRKGPAPAA